MKVCFYIRIQALVPQLNKSLDVDTMWRRSDVYYVTDVPSKHRSQNKVSGNSIPYFLELPWILSTQYPFFNFFFSNIYQLHEVTYIYDKYCKGDYIITMLAAICVVSIATLNPLQHFKTAFNFPNSGFAVYLCSLCFLLPYFTTQQLAVFNGTSNRNIIFLWNISDAHSGKQARYTLVGCDVSSCKCQHFRASCCQYILFRRLLWRMHTYPRIIQYDNRKWFAF
jgi:hypothetical protein